MAFRNIVGHRRLLSLLSQAIARQSLTPSLILSGPEGVGKRLTAISIAQELNCLSPTPVAQGAETSVAQAAEPAVAQGFSPVLSTNACGKCTICSRIARGTHPDVMTIEPGDTGSIKIEQVRAAIDRAVYRPFEGRRRVTIIDPADALDTAPQNALLKTLEEPLPASVFILVTSRPDTLLPTVRSRCAHLRFGRLQMSEVATILEQTENYPRQDALAAAAASDGSVRRALELEADEFVDARNEAEELLQAAGRDPRTRLERAKALLKGGGTPAEERAHLSIRLEAMGSLLRDVGLLSSGADAGLIANLDRRRELDAMARTLHADTISKAFAAVERAQEAVDQNVSPKVVADWLAVQL